MLASSQFIGAVEKEFDACRDYWTDIEISPCIFADYLWNIVRKHAKDSPDESSAIEFAKKLYLRDLYLACACVHKCENAWKAFDGRYRKFVTNLVRFCYRRGTDNEEIADLVLVGLYFDDRSGRQRIASYDGRSSLATWLRVIVINRAINDSNDRRLAIEENLADMPDGRALSNFETRLRAERYGEILRNALAEALGQLTPAERLMLLWRYEDNMPLGEIAHLLGIHQANVTRRLIRLQARVRESVIQVLSLQHRLSSAAIGECLTDIIENPLISISLLSLIKQPSKPVEMSVQNAAKLSIRLAPNRPSPPLGSGKIDSFPDHPDLLSRPDPFRRPST